MHPTPDDIKLGDKVRDSISGFAGVVTAKVEYINGCTQFGVAPPVDKEGKFVQAEYFDWQRLEVVEAKNKPVSLAAAGRPGGPQGSSTPPSTYRG